MWRKTVFVLTLVVASSVAADECWEVCDPYTSSCSQECERCAWHNEFDVCTLFIQDTCQSMGACIPDNCSPDFQETSRVNKGTYEGRSFLGCTHHRVDEVIVEDVNQCNIAPAYRSYTYCHDWIDGDKNNTCCYPSCCSGFADNGVPLSCNDVNTCS